MVINRSHEPLTAAIPSVFSARTTFWLSLSLTFTVIFGILQLQQAFASEYVVADDARQHVFWMRRFLDPALFPNDLIANYYQSAAPPAFAAVYRLAATVGVDPILLSKLLPLGLGLISTVYCFGVTLEIFPIPVAGFFATLFLNQSLWSNDDLSSGTARSYLYPLTLAFFYYLLRKSWFPCLVAIALQGLFYPPAVFTSAGVLGLGLVKWQHGRLQLTRHQQDYWFCAAGLVVTFLVLLPAAIDNSGFGPTISGAEARTMPEFSPLGRTRFFYDNPIMYWLRGERSGILPIDWALMPFWLKPPQILLSLLLPVLLFLPSRLPLVRQISHKAILLLQVLLVSLGMFFLAHAVLFKLYLPSRYTQHNFRMLAPIAGAIAFVVILDAVLRWVRQQANLQRSSQQFLGLGVAVLAVLLVVLYPSFFPLAGKIFPDPSYRTGQSPQLYEFLLQQPKDSLIASLTDETNNLPTFAQRPILASREYAIPYELGYYRQIRERAIDLIRAQYSADLATVQQVIEKYGIDFWLLEARSFRLKYVADNLWFKQYQPVTDEAIARLEQGTQPALAKVIDRCSVLRTPSLVLLQATCIVTEAKK